MGAILAVVAFTSNDGKHAPWVRLRQHGRRPLSAYLDDRIGASLPTYYRRCSMPSLSKSRFQSGLQCLKRLYLECYKRELADPVDPAQ